MSKVEETVKNRTLKRQRGAAPSRKGKIVQRVKGAPPAIDYFHDLKTKTWDALNSYAHTGILQLGRRFTGDKINPSYKDEEKIEVIRVGTTMLLMIVRPFLAKHGHNNEAVQIDEIGKRWLAASKKP